MNDPLTRCIDALAKQLQDPLTRELEALLAEALSLPDGVEIIERCLRETEEQFVTEDR